MIVRGTDMSFYVPRTGLEVLAGGKGGYVRKAYRLRKGKGLHLRVVKAFVAGEGDQVPAGHYEAGQDIFLADREGFFFPTDEPRDRRRDQRHSARASARASTRASWRPGASTTIVGPLNYLPDPTRVEIVQRELTDETRAELYGDRKTRAPGCALSIYVPSGFAVLVTAKSRREVVRGPQTRILAFDEDLEVLELSTGKPKTLRAHAAHVLPADRRQQGLGRAAPQDRRPQRDRGRASRTASRSSPRTATPSAGST